MSSPACHPPLTIHHTRNKIEGLMVPEGECDAACVHIYAFIPFLSPLDLHSCSADLSPVSLTGQAHPCLRNNGFALLYARKTLSLNSLLRFLLRYPLQRNSVTYLTFFKTFLQSFYQYLL